MLIPLKLIFGSPTLRMIAVSMILVGAINASMFPYQSLIAIQRIGISDNHYALLLTFASALAVTTTVAAGIITDQRANRRQIALLSAATSAVGPALMLAAPSPLTLILCHAILLPVAGVLYSQLFALARLACTDHLPHRDPILATIRAGLSLTFVVVLPLWSIAFGYGVDVMNVYALATLAGLALLFVIYRHWPHDGKTEWADAPSGLSFLQSLREIAHGPVLSRLALLGITLSGPALYMVLLSLVFAATPGRSTGDVALFVGLVAGWEVPFMLALPLVTHRFRRTTLIAVGAALYATYLALMPILAPYAAVWVLPLLAGFAGGAILTLPVAYLQDLMSQRPGTGASLIALQKVTSDTTCAIIFATGTWAGGYAHAATLGAMVMLISVTTLLIVDHRKA